MTKVTGLAFCTALLLGSLAAKIDPDDIVCARKLQRVLVRSLRLDQNMLSAGDPGADMSEAAAGDPSRSEDPAGQRHLSTQFDNRVLIHPTSDTRQQQGHSSDALRGPEWFLAPLLPGSRKRSA